MQSYEFFLIAMYSWLIFLKGTFPLPLLYIIRYSPKRDFSWKKFLIVSFSMHYKIKEKINVLKSWFFAFFTYICRKYEKTMELATISRILLSFLCIDY